MATQPRHIRAQGLAKLLKGSIPLNKIQRIAREEFNTFSQIPNELVLPYSVSSAIVSKYGSQHGFKAVLADVDLKRTIQDLPPDARRLLPPRPSILTVMGHVDHGKTTLLDSLRESNTAAQEAGGITQSVSAFKVPIKDKNLTFLDTPGHGAFHIMRETGSGVADIVLLVVALDEGVKPQTKESIRLALAAKTPVLAAINKIDLGGNIAKLRTHLKRLIPNPLLLDTVAVSAKLKKNLDELCNSILKACESVDARADKTAPVEGTVIEAVLDRGKGNIIRGVLHRGTLTVGQHLVAGLESGRVRALYSDLGAPIKEAFPGEPVQIAGLGGVPLPGEAFFASTRERIEQVVDYRKLVIRYQDQQQWSEQQPREITSTISVIKKNAEQRKQERKARLKARLEGKVETPKKADTQKDDEEEDDDDGLGIRIPIVVKAGNVGSLVMLLDSLHKMSDVDVDVAVVHASVGELKPVDIVHAEAEDDCPILCFNSSASADLLKDAKSKGVQVKIYSVVFDLLDDVKGRIMRRVKEREDEEDEGDEEDEEDEEEK